MAILWGRMTKIQDYCTPSKVIVRWFCEDLIWLGNGLILRNFFEEMNTLNPEPKFVGKSKLSLELVFFRIKLVPLKPENGKCGD